MARHKLADGPITMTVVGYDIMEGEYGPSVRIDGEGDVCVFISEKTAVRQLDRLKLDLASMVGETLRFEQVKKNGTTYTNLYKADPSTVGVSAPAASSGGGAAPAASGPKMSLEDATALYSKCVDAAIGTLGMKCEAMSIPIDAAAIQSAAATLFIKVTR